MVKSHSPNNAESAATGGAAVNQQRRTSTVLSCRVWEVDSPPPVNSLKGALVRPFGRNGRRRKISVEVHNITLDKGNRSYEECVVRMLDRGSNGSSKHDTLRTEENHPEGGIGNIFDDDESTICEENFLDNSDDLLNSDFEGWKPKYRFPISAMSIKKRQKGRVFLHIELGKLKQFREIIFNEEEEAESFISIIDSELRLEEDRAATKLRARTEGICFESNPDEIDFLIEVVSGWNLPIGDTNTSDPYVVCRMKGKEVHRTEYIPKTLDPVWTLDTGSLFFLTVNLKELFTGDGLECYLYDYDSVGKSDLLGIVAIGPRVLYGANGERMEFKLLPPPGIANEVPGFLAIRCRRATDYDKQFMADINRLEKSDLLGVKNAVKNASGASGGSSNIKSLVTKRSRIVKKGEQKLREYKIRPGPDPKRVDGTTWMTKEDLENECVKDSQHWTDTGSGNLGRLFVEILQCDDLPNLDTGAFAGNKTDAFVSLVFEDTATVTDVIDDTLSPRWMPWTKRAFIFHIYHSSSQLFLGVFDYDESISPTDDHDLVGRVSVDISNLRRNTVYTMKYNIFTTAKMANRVEKGSVTIRLRLEIPDERKLLLSGLEPPAPMYVNVKHRKDFRCIRYTCTGKYDMEKYSMKVINSYIEELLAVKRVLYYFQDGIICLFLWRGTMPLKMCGAEVKLPIHSFCAFFIAIYLVERPQLIPSFFFFALAWLMLASLGYRRRSPDVWARCKEFPEMGKCLVLGNSRAPPHSIKAYENYEKAKAFADAWKKRIIDDEEAATKAYEEQVRRQEEYEREMEEIGEIDNDISTKTIGGGVSIDPFKPLLFPFQKSLAFVCLYLRHVKYVLTWEECYIAFWVTSCCLLLSFMCFFVPWFFLLKWVSRVLVWSLFGPWMKLVDKFYVSQIKPLSDEEIAIQKREEETKFQIKKSAAVSEARIKRENAAKLKAMKKRMFGKYILKVPVLKSDRYQDFPLPDSKAVPYTREQQPLSELAMSEAGYRKTRVPGQNLIGDMIPTLEPDGFAGAPIGQPVSQSGPGGRGSQSTANAYVEIGSLITVAAAVTWFGVPLLASATKWALAYGN